MIHNAKEELMECLAEECSEVIKAKSKIMRFGETPERIAHLKEEIMDVIAVVAMLFEEMQISPEEEEKLYRLGEASMKKRDSYMKFKPKVRHT
jgi:NTP pyrophosphatase (non-canonical NTP hydrolase)